MKKIICLFVMVMLVSGCASVGHIAKDEDGWSLIGKTYYTKFNIWYKSTGKIYSAGVHMGEILPAGTEVRVDNYDFGNKNVDYKGYICFKSIGASIKLTSVGGFILAHNPRSPSIGWVELLDRYFSKQTITEEFNKFTEIEKQNIKDGKVVEGMSKEAVLMAWGYPLENLTYDLSLNAWEYRISGRRDSIVIYFVNNRINSIFMFDSLTLAQAKKTAAREMSGSYENIYSACKTVFVDRGYVIKEKDKDAGLIVAVLDARTAKKNRLAQPSKVGKIISFHIMKSVGFTNVELHCIVNKINDTISKVIIWDNGRYYPKDSRNNVRLLSRIRYYDKIFSEIAKELKGN